MKIAVGVFVFILFISLGAFSYFLLEAKGAFEKRYNYYFITDSADSFSVGMPVKFSGFAIGSIDKIALLEDGHVKITFSVTKENRKWINKYTYLLLKKPLIGSPHIEVLATSGNGELKPNSKLPIIITDDINDLVTKLEPVVDRLLNIIKNIETLTNQMVDANSPLNNTLKNLELFSAKLAHSDSLLTSITGDKASTQALIDSLHQIDSILHDIKNISQDLNNTLIAPTSASLHELHTILKDINTKLKTLHPLIQSIGDSSEDVENLKTTIEATIEKSNQLMDKFDAMLLDDSQKGVTLP